MAREATSSLPPQLPRNSRQPYVVMISRRESSPGMQSVAARDALSGSEVNAAPTAHKTFACTDRDD